MDLAKWIQLQKEDLADVKSRIAVLERTKARIEDKIQNPERWLKDGVKGIRNRRAMGEEIPKKAPPKKAGEVPAPKADPAQKTEQKSESKSGFGFFE